MIRRWSIRWKLTAWYIAAMAAILLMFGGLMTAMMVRQLYHQLNAQLQEEARELVEELREAPSADEIPTIFRRRYAEHAGYSFQISDANDHVISGSPWLRPHHLSAAFSDNDSSVESLKDVSLGHLGIHRVLRRRFVPSGSPLIIYVVTPYIQYYRDLRHFVEILVISGCAALFCACAGGLIIASRALKPLGQITSAAERISAENLQMSIEVDNSQDELGRLATTLNDTFGRLRESVDRIRRFTADAAHELRTPLSVLRTRLEVALRLPVDADDRRDSYQVAIAQTDRLKKVVDQLLVLSRHDAGVAAERFDEVELMPLINDVMEILQPVAQEKAVRLSVGSVPDCAIWGDDISLSRVFFNLIDNAIKYSRTNGQVVVSGECDEQKVRLGVTDTGIGIEPEHLPKLFDRFYRVDAGRNGQTGGAGLGLAICQSIVEAHGGAITVDSASGEGATFTVELPLSQQIARMDVFTRDLNASTLYTQIDHGA